MMPFSLGVCLGHRSLAFVVTSHIIECTPATSWHVYTSQHSPACTPATRGSVVPHVKRWLVATVPLCSIEYPPKTTVSFLEPHSIFEIPICLCSKLPCHFQKAPTPFPPPPPHRARLPPSAIAASTATPIARSADRISGFCFDENIKGDHGNPSTCWDVRSGAPAARHPRYASYPPPPSACSGHQAPKGALNPPPRPPKPTSHIP